MLKIVELNEKNQADINKANESFEIIGRIKPSFIGGRWTYEEEIYTHIYLKTYPNDTWDCFDYIENRDKAIYLAYLDEKCVGQIVLKKDWNRYAFIEDICSSRHVRGKGIGTILVEKADAWARETGLSGLALETQDNNLLACRFYAKCGFAIGAVNTMLYRNFEKPWCDEIAIFWYKLFS